MDKAWLQARLAEGKSLATIAEEAGCSSSTVGRWIERHGLEAVGKAKHAAKGSVDDRELRALVEAGFSIREIGIACGLTYAPVRAHLRRLGLETRVPGRRRPGDDRRCHRHGIELYEYAPNRFRCRRCVSEATSRARRRLKAKLAAEFGGRCAICGYDTCLRALEFHHVDPSQKAFAIGVEGVTRSLEALRAEAAKCVLLCRNCHAEVEAGVTELLFSPPLPITGANADGR
jgi:DNA-binding CsgD family transcriptional regulator